MKKIKIALFACIGLIIFAASCSVDNGDNPDQPIGAFLMTNVSPDAPPLNVYINGSSITPPISYGVYTLYNPAIAGSYAFQVTDVNNVTVLNSTVTIEADKYYSYFIIDSFSKVKAALTLDKYTVPGPDSTYIRFFNFSPNSQPLSLYDSAGKTKLFSDRVFNNQAGFTDYMKVPEGIYTYLLRQPDSTKLASRLDTLVGGHVYTFFAKGFVGGTGTQSVGIGRIQNY